MKFKPFSVKFTNEKLNKSVSFSRYNNDTCNKHDTLKYLECVDGQIYCKECHIKLTLVPAWIII